MTFIKLHALDGSTSVVSASKIEAIYDEDDTREIWVSTPSGDYGAGDVTLDKLVSVLQDKIIITELVDISA